MVTIMTVYIRWEECLKFTFIGSGNFHSKDYNNYTAHSSICFVNVYMETSCVVVLRTVGAIRGQVRRHERLINYYIEAPVKKFIWTRTRVSLEAFRSEWKVRPQSKKQCRTSVTDYQFQEMWWQNSDHQHIIHVTSNVLLDSNPDIVIPELSSYAGYFPEPHWLSNGWVPGNIQGNWDVTPAVGCFYLNQWWLNVNSTLRNKW